MSSKKQPTSLLVSLSLLVAGMFALAYAAVPLYDLFCRATGYGGATQESKELSQTLGQKDLTIRFNADIAKGLPWEFRPVQKSIKVRTGENKLVFYEAENKSNTAVKGVATFNVTPSNVGVYFNKVDCFCFEEQTLEPGQKVDMPITFFVDPEIENDPNLKKIDTITLSYTFFEAKEK